MRRFLKKQWACQLLAVSCILVCMSFDLVRTGSERKTFETISTIARSFSAEKELIYDSLGLGSLGLSHAAFSAAIAGFEKLQSEGKILKDNLVSILDFSLPSGKKRLFVIDIISGELVYHTYAAHGKKSGTLVATQFSNKPNSNKSSLGFYITRETYQGKHGTSLRLEGEEKGINDNALSRGIVMHSAKYVDESIIARQGFIGRSQGCPALPANIYKDVIETIKEGSCLFIYSPDKYYNSHSKILKAKA